MDRKQFIKWAGTLGGVFTLGGLLARKEEDKSEICSTPYSSSYSPPPVNVRTNHVYGSMFEPPINIGEKYSSQFYFPKNKKIEYIEESFDLNLIPFKIQIAHSVNYDAWTFNGTVPGPIIRTKQGKELQFKFTNSSTEPHSLHFHGSHSPQEDGWEGVPSFGKKTYKIKPLLHGIYP
ncbi:MAG: multicopper oxidase domain-containing protein, partial [Leptospiraceae bacterium]|nr:multicopper oxidase domain-containing protein [Leptospiraceae bacterium]